ncbi:MAG: hypothetical protein PHE53_02030 [Thermoguttaceae bacterium]|nr:hypothetical protein [Thermoguttaceae bacterium]
MLSDLLKSTSTFFCIATTCGGDAIRELLETPGISSYLLEIQIPYAAQAMREYLQCDIEQACSEQTARLLASQAHARTKKILAESPVHMENSNAKMIGVGVTASLASQRMKHGDHRIEAAVVSDDEVHTFRLVLNKNVRTRAEEDSIAAEIMRLAIAMGASLISDIENMDTVAGRFSLFPQFETLQPPEHLVHHTCRAISSWISLWQKKERFLAGRIVNGIWEALSVQPEYSVDMQNFHAQDEAFPRLIFPGSYHPLHQGHQDMLRYAENMFKIPGWYECSLCNVDKPPLDYMEVCDRLKIFPSGSRILLTQLPTFEEKSSVFPGAIFIIGADTLIRLADSKYYAYNEELRLEALQRIADRGCRFLVFGRTTTVPLIKLKQPNSNDIKQDLQEVKNFITPQDLVIPPLLEKMCIFVSESEFHEDISSTEIRRSRT